MKMLLDEISVTSSRNLKIELIQKQLANDNKEFIDLLVFLFDFRIVTGISTKKINKTSIKVQPDTHFKDYTEVMQYLMKNNTGSDLVLANIQSFIKELPDEYKRFMSSIITKTIKIGLDVKSINQAANNLHMNPLILQYDCMLAFKYQDNTEHVKGKSFTITTKHDGIRVNAIKDNGKVSLYSRQGQPIIGLIDIETELANLPFDDFVLDGELMVAEYATMNSTERYKATTRIVRKDGEKHGVKILAFDVISLDEFLNQKGMVQYSDRRRVMEEYFEGLQYIEILPILYIGDDMNEIENKIEEAVNNGEEGVMININDAVYSFGRTKNLLKYKKWQDCDIRCTGVEEGTGENVGKLGAITVEFPFNGKTYSCKCGTGFSASKREYYWSHPDEIINHIVTIKYFEISQNDQGGYGLRFPVFKDVTNKDEISMN